MKRDLGTPASLFGDPTNLCLTDGAHDPVTAVFLDDYYLTRRTLHRVAKLQQLLQYTPTQQNDILARGKLLLEKTCLSPLTCES